MKKWKFSFGLTSFILSIITFIFVVARYQITIPKFIYIILSWIYLIAIILVLVFSIISFIKKEEKWYFGLIALIILFIIFFGEWFRPSLFDFESDL